MDITIVAAPAIRTVADIEALKANWRADPIWDIEETEGFEAHRAELMAYRLEQEAVWAAVEQRRKDARCAELGIAGNHTLLAYLESLENRINALSQAVEGIYFRR